MNRIVSDRRSTKNDQAHKSQRTTILEWSRIRHDDDPRNNKRFYASIIPSLCVLEYQV